MNIFNAPLPGTTLRTITEEWKVLSEFHILMRQRMMLEAEHLLRLRQFQESIDPNWSKSGAWALISPVVELWSSQTSIMEECGKTLIAIIEACPSGPSPDESEEGIVPYSRYDQLHGPYKAYQDCQTAASTKNSLLRIGWWFRHDSIEQEEEERELEPMPEVDRNYRESVVKQRNTLRPVIEWHSTKLPNKLEAHVRYAEETQTCLRNYLVEHSKSTSDLVKSISTAQKRLAEFSSLAFIHPSQKSFENESLHPLLQPAVYLSHYLGGVPAEPVLGVVSYLPELVKGIKFKYKASFGTLGRELLEAEKDGTNFHEIVQKVKERYGYVAYQSHIVYVALNAIGPLLRMDGATYSPYRKGIRRDDIAQLLKPFPIENCRMASIMIPKMYKDFFNFRLVARWIIGTEDARQIIEDIWRKWDFENHRPLPREVIRRQVLNDRVEDWDWQLVFKKTYLPYKPSQ